MKHCTTLRHKQRLHSDDVGLLIANRGQLASPEEFSITVGGCYLRVKNREFPLSNRTIVIWTLKSGGFHKNWEHWQPWQTAVTLRQKQQWAEPEFEIFFFEVSRHSRRALAQFQNLSDNLAALPLATPQLQHSTAVNWYRPFTAAMHYTNK